MRWVLAGRTQPDGITIGATFVPPPVAGSRIVEGGGLLIPAHGLGWVEGHVMLVFVELRPRASMTAPDEGIIPLDGVSI
jgi:hypothetical protein